VIDEKRNWLIWSNEHGQWWAPGRHGYVTLITEAGRYTFTEALTICFDANCWLEPHEPPKETMLRSYGET
jgi:hypothetical protein